DPTDVEVAAELRACTGQRIDVVVATTDALDRAFSRVYGDRGDESESRPPGHAENGRAGGEGMGQLPLTASPSEPTASVSRGDTVLHPASLLGLGSPSMPSGRGWRASGSLPGAGSGASTRSRPCCANVASDGPSSNALRMSSARAERIWPARASS